MKKTNVQDVGSKAAANMVASKAANHENAVPVMVFECSEFGCIRILTDEKGEPQFCGKDVCGALGYLQADKAIARHVDEDDRTKRAISTPIISHGKATCAFTALTVRKHGSAGKNSIAVGNF